MSDKVTREQVEEQFLVDEKGGEADLRIIENYIDQQDARIAELEGVFHTDIHCANFAREQRNRCFQLIGMYDGSISDECRRSFQNQYEMWDRIIKANEPTNERGRVIQ